MAGSDSITVLYFSASKFCIAALLVLSPIVSAGGDPPAPEQADDRPPEQEAARSDQIECVAPGKTEAIRLTANDAKIRYPLRCGVTSFIIHLAAPGQRRYFTLENENMAVKGRLSIAVSNERLAANNPKWNAVAGAISFRHKRLFDLSLIGVEAKFVKLTFQVDDPGKITGRDEPEQPPNRFTVQQ